MRYGRFVLAGIILAALIAASVVWRVPIRERMDAFLADPLPEPMSITPRDVSEARGQDTNVAETPLPDQMNLNVPFTSQAPHANWDLPYQEACEEAAALIVHRYWTQESFASADDADASLRSIVDFENETYGSYKDTTAEETARFIRDLWGYTVDVLENPSLEMIKREVTNGYPVIVPTAGRLLGNPNFSGEGPIYHMIVVKGYTRDGRLITNDPGTRKGADYVYDADTVMNAMHDWNDGDVVNGTPVLLVPRPAETTD